MENNSISISTITLSRNDKEEYLLNESLQQLAQLNIPVFVADGGSGKSFVSFLTNYPHFRLVQEESKGVYAQAKNSLKAAYEAGSEFILYTEPDKKDFFLKALPAFFKNAAIKKETGIILASRSGTSFATFPSFQQMTETTINSCCSEIIGNPFDFTYGPFILNRKLVPYLNLVKEDIGWGWRPFIFGIAKRLGYTIESIQGEFACPNEQQEDSKTERIYRMKQLKQNIQGVVLSTEVVLP